MKAFGWLAGFFFLTPTLALGEYKITGTCDGLPRIDVDTPAGICVGLVSDGFVFPTAAPGISC